MRKKKILVCLLLFLGYIIAALLGLLDRMRVSIFSPGNYFFPEIGHAFGYQFILGIVVDLCFYGLILYGIVSLAFYLVGKYRSR